MIIEKVRVAYNSKKLSAKADEIEILELIGKLLKDDACFLKIDIQLALKMLLFLGYDKEKAKEIYAILITESMQLLNGKYHVTDTNHDV